MTDGPRERRGRGAWLDESERRRLITEHAWLVERVVGWLMPMLPDTVSRDELVVRGIEGLIRAIHAFDPERGVPFERGATAAVRRAVLEELRSLAWAPPGAGELCARLRTAIAQMTRELGRLPEEEQVATALHVSVEQYRAMLSEAGGVALVELSSLLAGEPAGVPQREHPNAAEDRSARRRELKQPLATAIGELPQEEQLVIAVFYHEDLTFEEIAELLGVPSERVCQLHTQAALRLLGKLSRGPENA